jgi:hypothetical protein
LVVIVFFKIFKVADSYYHKEVPISGMVKSVSDDGKSTMELVAFGKSGSVKSF